MSIQRTKDACSTRQSPKAGLRSCVVGTGSSVCKGQQRLMLWPEQQSLLWTATSDTCRSGLSRSHHAGFRHGKRDRLKVHDGSGDRGKRPLRGPRILAPVVGAPRPAHPALLVRLPLRRHVEPLRRKPSAALSQSLGASCRCGPARYPAPVVRLLHCGNDMLHSKPEGVSWQLEKVALQAVQPAQSTYLLVRRLLICRVNASAGP